MDVRGHSSPKVAAVAPKGQEKGVVVREVLHVAVVQDAMSPWRDTPAFYIHKSFGGGKGVWAVMEGREGVSSSTPIPTGGDCS